MDKIELTWDGKRNRTKIESCKLVEETEKGYFRTNTEKDIFDNRLIFGDNLVVLKALEQEFIGMVKCVYIDPPYNTGSAFEHYDDGVEHSIWLSLMRERLEALWKLLTPDGLMAIQIDDNEFARLFLLCVEVCGEINLKVICVKMSEPSGLKMGTVKRLGTLPKLKEYVILCGKNGVRGLDIERIPKGAWDSEYNIFLDGMDHSDRERIAQVTEKEEITFDDIRELDKIGARIQLISLAGKMRDLGLKTDEKNAWLFENAWRICQCATSASVLTLAREKRHSNSNEVFFVKSARGLVYMVRASFSDQSEKPRLQLIFADDNLTVHPGDLWTDFKTTGLDGEGGVDFKNGKKPERLIARIIRMATKPGDLVLDSFAGSGTTGAVAHKMGRRWIMVELGEHCHTHIIPRLQKVIDGEDKGGITDVVNWKGGGGFRYFKVV